MRKQKHQSLLKLIAGMTAIMATALLCAVAFLGTTPVLAVAGTNETVNYQGRLLTGTGAVVPDGSYNMEFKITQDGDGCNPTSGTFPCSGTVKWTETRESSNKVLVKNGYFSVYLGSVTPFGSSVDWDQDTLWLSVNIGGTGVPSYDGAMKPLTRLSSTPYALNSKMLGGLTKAQFVQFATGAQIDTSTTAPSIFINKTGATANILQLQRNNSDVLVLDTAGVLTSGGGIVLAANQNLTSQAGTGTITLNSTVSNASDDAILITPSFTGGATDALVYNGVSLAGFSPTNAAGTDTVNGIKIGNITDPGATIISSALTLGSGWDSLLDTQSIDITGAGVITGATGISSSGTINFSGLTASRALFTDSSNNLVSTGASADLLNSLSDETGTGVAVFGTSPTITTSLVTGSSSFDLLNTTATTVNAFGAGTTINVGASTGNTNVLNNLDVAGTISSGTSNAFQVNASGDVTSNIINLNGSSTTNGAALVASTSMTLTDASSFDVGNYIKLDNNGSACSGGETICYAKITAKATNILTINPGLVWSTGRTVTEVHIPEIGGTNTAQTLANRYGRGYFISGVATGNGTTYYDENGITSNLSTFNIANENVTTLNIGAGATTINLGSASTNINFTNISSSNNISSPLFTYAGNVALSSTGAGNDVTITSADQIYLTGFDCSTLSNGGVLTVDANGRVYCDNDDGGGGGSLTGSGTTNRLPYFSGTTSLGNSWLLQNVASNTLQLDTGKSVELISGNLTLTSGNLSVTGTTTTSGLITGNGGLSVTSGGVAVTGNSTIAGTLGSLTGLTSAGTVTFSGLNSAGVVHTNASGVLSTSAVVLGTDTSGNYAASLGSLTGLSTTGNTGAGSTPTLSVLYGSTANTAVQGDTTLTCPSGTGNLTGGGTSITMGTGGVCGAINTVTNPTFSGLVTASANTTGLAVTGAPTNSATASLVQIGNAIVGGSTAVDGGTYLGLNAPASGAGSAADFINFQLNGTNKLLVTNSGAITAAGALTVTSGGVAVTGNSTIAGTLSSLTGLTSSGPITFSGLASAGVVHNNASGVLSTGDVILSTETSGNYIATLGTLTGLSTSGNTGEGSTPTISVLYGSAVDTAVQGNVQLTVTAGTGLSGGGSITLGAGGTATLNLDINGITSTTAVSNSDYLPIYSTSSSSVRKITRADFLQGILGALIYHGTWDASTNTPTISNGTGVAGDMYVVSVAGTQNLGAGNIITFGVGDFAIHNGTIWEKAPSASAVTSVFTRTGAITAQNGDYAGLQITNTAAGNIAATNVQAAINELDTEKTATTSALSFTGSGNLSGSVSGTAGGGFTTNTLAVVSNPTFTGLITSSANTTGLALTGNPVAGTGATSLLQLGNAISGGNSGANGGTYIGINEPNGGAASNADFLNFQVNGIYKLKVDNTGLVNTAGGVAVSGTTVLTSGRALQNLTGLTVSSGGASITGDSTITGNLNVTGTISGSAPATGTSGYWSRSGTTLQPATSGDAITTTGNISTTGLGTITSVGAFSGPTSTNTINGLVVNTGALSAITGYTQTSGNFSMSGIGTFATGTGNVTLNGATNVSANRNFSLSSGTGTFNQAYSNTTGVAATFAVTDSSAAGASTVEGISIDLTGTVTSGTNTITGLDFNNVAATANNTYYALRFGTGFNDLLRYNNTQIISGAGLLQNAALDSTLTYSNLTKVGAITVGTWNATAVGAQWGGTGLNTSVSTGVPIISSGTWSVASALGAGMGGTGLNTSASTGVATVSSGVWSITTVLSGITGFTQTSGTHNITSAVTSGNAFSLSDSAFNINNASLANFTFSNVNSSATPTTVSGLSITPTGGANANANANTLNAINLPNVTPVTNNQFNAFNIGTGYSNLIKSANFTLASTGAISAATGITSSGTINFSALTASRALFTDASKNLVSSGASVDLLNAITDETGTGAAVFGTSPSITTSLTTGSTSFDLVNTTATTVNFAGAATILSVGSASGTTTINGALAVAANKNLTLNSGTGTFTQTYTGTVDAHTIIANSITATNSALALSATGLTTGIGLDITGGTALTTGSLMNLSAATYNPGSGNTGSAISVGAITHGGTNPSGNAVVNGISMASTFSTSGNGTKDFNVFNASAPTLTACTANCTWNGFKASTAASSLATVTQNGINIAAGNITAGSQNGVNIGSITGGGSATETALRVGTGWDNVLLSTASPVASATVAQISLGGALSGGSANGTYIGINPSAFTGDFENYQVNNTTKFSISNAGSLVVGGASGTAISVVNGSATLNASAGCTTTANIVGSAGFIRSVTCAVSDSRFKTNVQTVESALEGINRLNAVTYDFNDLYKQVTGDTADHGIQYGMLAQDLEKVFPGLVKPVYGQYKTINYLGFTAVLLRAIQELDNKVINQMTQGSNSLFENISVSGLSTLNDVNVSGTVTTKLLNTNNISVGPDGNLQIKLNGGAQFVINGQHGENLATVDAFGNASFAGNISALNLDTTLISSYTTSYNEVLAKLEEATKVNYFDNPEFSNAVDARIKSVFAGTLEIPGAATFSGEVNFLKLVSFAKQATFYEDVLFKARPIFSNDNGGFATIVENDNEIKIVFNKPFSQTPVVSVNNTDGQFVDYTYKDLTKDGFTIVLKTSASKDITFSWTAFAIDNALTQLSRSSAQPL